MVLLIVLGCHKKNTTDCKYICAKEYFLVKEIEKKTNKLYNFWKMFNWDKSTRAVYVNTDSAVYVTEIETWLPYIKIPNEISEFKYLEKMTIGAITEMPDFEKLPKSLKELRFTTSYFDKKGFNWEISNANVENINITDCEILKIKFKGRNKVKYLCIEAENYREKPVFEYDKHSLDELETIKIDEAFNLLDFDNMPKIKEVRILNCKGKKYYELLKEKYPNKEISFRGYYGM